MRLPDDRVVKLTTPHVPKPVSDPDAFADVQERYLSIYFRSVAAGSFEPEGSDLPTVPTTRRGGSIQQRSLTLWSRKP